MLKRQGVHTSKKRVERIMAEYGIQGISKSRKRHKKRQIEVRDDQDGDLVRREFSTYEPNRL